MADNGKSLGQNEEIEYGVALILDLQDSTIAWDQDQEVAKKMLDKFAACIRTELNKFKGEIENFTGDGFLLIFKSGQIAINYTASLIESWEEFRKIFLKDYGLPSDSSFFIIRSGIEFGSVFKWQGKRVGSTINRAQRCEAASKELIKEDHLKDCKRPLTHYQVFITTGVWNEISKQHFYCSKELQNDFKGIQGTQIIYSVWPKEKDQLIDDNFNEQKAEKIANAISSIEIASRLMEEADKYLKMSEGRLDSTSRELIERAVNINKNLSIDKSLPKKMLATANLNFGNSLCYLSQRQLPQDRSITLNEAVVSYREALKDFTFYSAPSEYGTTLSNLGSALCNQAELLQGSQRSEKLQEAVETFREALKVRTLEKGSFEYALTQNNLGNALRYYAELLPKEEDRQEKINEAIEAFNQALKFRTFENAPRDFAMTQNNLGNALRYQSGLLRGNNRKESIEKAIMAYHEALRAYTLEQTPSDYAMVQNNLGNALCNMAELFRGAERANILIDAIKSYHKALKIRTLQHSPTDYAMTQNNLGNALRNQAALLKNNKKAKKLKEAVAAYREALKVYTLQHAPPLYAMTQNNLGLAFEEQAKLCKGENQKKIIKNAENSFEEARKVYENNFPDPHDKVQKNIQRLEKVRSSLKNKANKPKN